jgi:hypothetical protein
MACPKPVILHTLHVMQFLQSLNQLEKAEELIQTAMKLQPENALCHFTLG